MRTALGFVRKSSTYTKHVTDGWQLVHVGLACVRELEPSVWVSSFKKVNLHPHHRVDFPSWCKRISHFLQGGESFKEETQVDDYYSMLPTFWHGMLPAEKKLVISIFQAHESSFSVACVTQLHQELHVPMTDMQNLRVCIELALEDPSHVDRGVPEATVAACSNPKEVSAARAGLADVASGLVSFQLHPKNAAGEQLFSGERKLQHLVKMVRRSVPPAQVLCPSPYLDVEYSVKQQVLLDPSPTDFSMHEIIRTTHGEGAKQSMAKRKIDALGNLRGQSGFSNDPKRMKRLENQLLLAQSIGEISKQTTDARASKHSTGTSLLIGKGPDAVAKLKEKGGDASKLTRSMTEIKAVAMYSFGGVELKGDKTGHVSALSKLITSQPYMFSVLGTRLVCRMPRCTNFRTRMCRRAMCRVREDDP